MSPPEDAGPAHAPAPLPAPGPDAFPSPAPSSTGLPAYGGRLFARLSIRNKLLVLVLLPLLVVLPLLGLALLLWGSVAFDRMLVTKVGADLAVANGYFERVLGEVDASTAAVADAHALHALLARQPPGDSGDVEALRALLASYRDREGLDVVTLRHADGSVHASSNGPLDAEDGLGAHALAAGDHGHTSVEVLLPAQQSALSAQQRARVAVPLLPTRNAVPTDRSVEDRAMVLLSSKPVRGRDGRLIGHVQGARLLNRNLDFIDHINAIVYPEGSLPFGSQGTATLFLDDVRISTNVRLFGAPVGGAASGERAIGTRVSHSVRETVLGERRTWLDRAFVVNDWYVSAYQPLLDGAGRAVGMLYVGYLEQPFRLLKYAALASIGLIFFPVMLGAAWVSLRWARSIFRPLEQMEATMRRVEAGDGAARVGALGLAGSQDEIGRLAGHLDHLLEVIDDKTRSLQRWNAALDAKVAERTRQLAAAQSQLVRNEKLAAVGQLTASIAHEVNNPIAVIQGNLDLVRELLGPHAAAVKGELKLVDEQIERMRLIVTQLLQFARPTEFAGYVEAVDSARVLADCLVLVNHLLVRGAVQVRRDLRATHTAGINRQELQQVLVNLLVNAIQAMPDGGTLTLATRDIELPGAGDRPVPGLEITVADTGTGLPAELLSTLFEPFVTRKKEGTGLGLWISRSLVERYGGELRGANRDDGQCGAVFTLRLRAEALAPEA